MNFKMDKKTASIFAIVFVLSFAVRLVDIDKPYETWDEITTYTIGLNLWYNIAHLDFSQTSWHTYDISGSTHPPMARYAYGIVNAAYLLGKTGPALFSMKYDEAVLAMYNYKSLVPGRMLSALFAAATAAFIFVISKRYFGSKVAIMSALMFALLPVSMAQTKIAALDAMMVFMFTLAVYLFIKGLDDRKYIYASFTITGLAVATKFNTITLFILLPALYLAYRMPKSANKKRLVLKSVVLFAGLAITSAVMLYAVWPRLWFDPVGGLLANFGLWQSFGNGNVTEFFFGGFDHPLIYIPAYVVVTMPVLLLAFFVIGTVLSAKERKFGNWIMLAWFLIPLLLYSPYHFKQAGPRYVFMIYPALAMLTAIGINWLSSKVSNIFKREKKQLAYLIVPAVTFAYLVSVLIAVHPFYLDYYNELVGGPKNVYENKMFAIGQWGEGIGEAAYWLYGYAENGSTVQFFVMPRHCIPPLRPDMKDLTPFKPKYLSNTGDNENWIMTNVTPEAEYIVENTFFRWYLNESWHNFVDEQYKIIHVIGVQRAPLAWVYERK